MDIIEEAFRLLYPDREFGYSGRIKYTDHFKDYGANVRLRGNEIVFGLSRSWRGVSREIRIGLLQELMLKLFSGRMGQAPSRESANMMYVDLYNNFVRNLHIAIPKDRIDPFLAESFSRVNERYFYGSIESPNLIWGQTSTSSLGSYDFKTDTIKISRVFKKLSEDDPQLLDLVMYHEILHKAHKFRSRMGKNRYHDSAFRGKEREFENFHEVDLKLKNALKRARIKRFFWFD